MNTHVSLLAGLIFAVHPVHTEAVAGVVGRAELLAAVFFLSCLLVHQRRRSTSWTWVSPVLAGLAMLAKEQGVTVLAVCASIDVLRCGSSGVGRTRRRLMRLFLSGLMLVSLRSLALDGVLPAFSRSDNPASHEDSLLTRTLTFLLLPALNFNLLLTPATLR